jgi:hypothetical protein
MRHKLGVVILAAVMTLAGTREAFRQFSELKASVNEWTRTSILGNLLVFAADGAQATGAQPQTVVLAQTYLPCKGEHTHSAAPASRPASRTKAVNSEHAKTERIERAAGFDGLAMRFATSRDVKSSERVVVHIVPQIAEIEKTLGAGLDDDEAAQMAVRARAAGEAGAARTRVVAEWKKFGLRKVFVRVARREGAAEQEKTFTFRLPEAFAPAFDLKSLAGLDAVPTQTEVAPEVTPHGVDQPSEQFDFSSIFDLPATPTSFGCDSDPLI